MLRNNFLYYQTCSLRFARFKFYISLLRFVQYLNSFIQTCSLRFKINFQLSKVFASLRYRRKHHYRSFRSASLRYPCHDCPTLYYFQRSICCFGTCLHYRGLCCSRRCLHHRGLSCIWTCLHYRGMCCS